MDLPLLVKGDVAWIFIDGCHCYECVSSEIVAWKDRILPGGLIVFHDVDSRYEKTKDCQWYHGDLRSQGGVYKAVIESKLEEFDFSVIHENPAAQRRNRMRYLGGMRIYKRNIHEGGDCTNPS